MSRQTGPERTIWGRRPGVMLALALIAAVLAPVHSGAAELPQIQVFGLEEIRGSFFSGNTSISVVIDRVQGGPQDAFNFAIDGSGNFQVWLRDFGVTNLDVGDQVQVTEGSVTKVVTVEAIEVVDSDILSDTVWGTAVPGTPVEVYVHIDEFLSVRRVVANAAGEWLADFSIPGPLPDESAVDFPYGQSVGGEAVGPLDADGDRTGWHWGTRAPMVWVRDNHMSGDGWLYDTVDVRVDDPGSPGTDYQQSLAIQGGGFHLDLAPGVIKPGNQVDISDGFISASFVVPLLSIAEVNPATELVVGTAAPGLVFDVNADADDGSAGAGLMVTAGFDGAWTADFATIVDIGYGWSISANAHVSPNAAYVAGQQIPLPIVAANHADGDISGRGWPAGSEVDVEIDDPEVQGEVADFAFTISTVQEPGQPGAGFDRFLGEEFPIKPGYVVTASDVAHGGDIVKVLVVERAEIDAIQTSFDTISGWAPPNRSVEVYNIYGDGGRRSTVADADGWWLVDFSQSSGSGDQEENKIVDLTIGTSVEMRLEADDDGDYTRDQAVVQIQAGGGLPPVVHTVGLVNPDHGLWRLLDENGTEHTFYYGSPGDIPMVGDWDCDGDETPGLYRQSDGYVYLRNSNDTGPGEVRFTLGIEGDIPLAGDFNGDGCDTVAVYRPSEGHVYMTNVLGENEGFFVAEYDYYFGDPGDKPFVGDFDGDGVETVGLHRESTGFVYFRQTHTTGAADSEFFFGNPNDRIMAGDWNESYQDTVAIFRPADATFYFRNSNTLGVADDTLEWGQPSWLPVAGEFGP